MQRDSDRRLLDGVLPRHGQYEGFRRHVKAIGTGERGRRPLGRDEAHAAVTDLLRGDATPAQAGAFLISMRIKGETADEMAGMAQALRDAAVPLRPPADGRPVVACAGSYDGIAESPALSLAAAIVASAAGAACVVHCGDSLGPKYGLTPAHVLDALGGDGRPEPTESEEMLARAGMALVHAGTSLEGWTALAELRDQIGPRGPIHSAEKLVDWFGATRFVVGYTHAAYADRLLGGLDRLRADSAVVVRGIEGSDIMRPGRPVARSLEGDLDLPEQLGEILPTCEGAAASAALTRAVCAGEGDRVHTYTTVLSAGLRLHVAGLTPSVLRGIAVARTAIDAGRATATLEALVGT